MSYTDKLTALSNSIKAKNPNYTGNLSLAKMKEAVDNISSGVDTSVITATAADCLSTKKILLADGSLVSGSIATNSAVTKTLTTSSTSYTIPSGYEGGTSVISINEQSKSVTPTTSSQNITADSGKVLTSVVVSAVPGRGIYKTGSFTHSGSDIYLTLSLSWDDMRDYCSNISFFRRMEEISTPTESTQLISIISFSLAHGTWNNNHIIYMSGNYEDWFISESSTISSSITNYGTYVILRISGGYFDSGTWDWILC